MMVMSTRFVLASGSPRRSDLLRGLGITFEVIKPDVDEREKPGEVPEDYVRRLSEAKAAAVVDLIDGPAYILAADTTVIHKDDILGKPATEDEARRMLLRLRGDFHRVCTGFTALRIADSGEQTTHTEVVCTDVYMRPYAASEMERWIMSGQAFDKAGGYAIQSLSFPAVERIDGSYNNVVGLPTDEVQAALSSLGWHFDEENGSS